MINPHLCQFNISDHLYLICSQPANKLINNSLSSGRALKHNIQRASFWKCPFLKTCKPWTSMWAERQSGMMMSFTDGSWSCSSWMMTQLSGQWLSHRPYNGNTGIFSPALYAETIHLDAAFRWKILWAWCHLLDLSVWISRRKSNGDIKFHFSRLKGCWRGSPQSTSEVE